MTVGRHLVNWTADGSELVSNFVKNGGLFFVALKLSLVFCLKYFHNLLCQREERNLSVFLYGLLLIIIYGKKIKTAAT